nr:transporter [uncultured Duganella sp.]
MNKYMTTLACAGLCMLYNTAAATEGGGSTYLPGADMFLMGAVPPPGLYVLGFAGSYESTRLLANNGDRAPLPGFKLNATVAATRIVWSTPYTFAGGNLVAHVILPLVDISLSAAGMHQHKTGLADITFGPGFVRHYSDKLHSVLGVDFVAPTGRYVQTDLVNIGRNYWSVQPLYTMAYTDPSGFNGDFKATLNINRHNSATEYKSGNEFILDYVAGHAVGDGWIAGLGGYFYQQLTADRQAGREIEGSKGKGFALGPTLKYGDGKGVLVMAKLERELYQRNRPQGTALRIKALIPF